MKSDNERSLEFAKALDERLSTKPAQAADADGKKYLVLSMAGGKLFNGWACNDLLFAGTKTEAERIYNALTLIYHVIGFDWGEDNNKS